MADVADLNPEFASRLAAFRAGLSKAGIETNIASGYRSPEYQAQLYANYQAKQSGQPLPYPNVNKGSIAAPAWQSFHNYGLAADVTPANSGDYQRMWAMAPQYGLTALGKKDIDHFQMAGDLPSLVSQYNLAGWRPASQPAPATGAVAYAGPSGAGGAEAPAGAAPTRPGSYGQGGIGLINAELAKRGIGPQGAAGAIAGIMGESSASLDPTSFNTKDPGGGSGGIGQWNRERLIGNSGMLAFAKSNGVDVDINNPLDAKKVPLGVQAAYIGHELDTTYSGVRDQLKTAQNPQDALKIWVNSYENPADKDAAIAQRTQYLDPVSKALAGGAAAPATTSTPGTTLNTAGGLPGFPDKGTSDLFTKGLEQITGKPAGLGGQGQGQGQDQLKPSPMLAGPGARNTSPLGGAMLPSAPQTYGQTLNSLNAPLQWGSTPIGASPYSVSLPVGGRMAGAPQPVGAQAPQPIGTSLTSLQNMDPQAYQDKLAMLYGAQSGGGSFGGGYG